MPDHLLTSQTQPPAAGQRGRSARAAPSGPRDPSRGPAPGSPEGGARHLQRHASTIVLGCLVALATIRYLVPGLDGRLDVDAGIYAYGGQQAAEGVPPYVSVLNRSGPLAHLGPALAVVPARLLGVDDLTAMRLFYLLLSVATVAMVSLLATWVMRSLWAGVVAGTVMLSFHGFAAYAAFGPREKTLLVFFLVATLVAGARARWVLAGVGVAAATLTWQPAFLAAFAGVVAMALLRRRETGEPGRGAALLRIVLGGLAPTLVTVAAYAAIGQLRAALDAFLLINLRYTVQDSVLQSWPSPVKVLAKHDGWTALFIVVGFVVLVVLAVAALLRARGTWRLDPPEATLVGLGAAALGALGWSLRAFGNWPDTFILLPFGALGTAALVPLAGRLAPRAAVPVAVALALVATTAAGAHAVALREEDGLRVQRQLAAEVNDVLGPDAVVLSLGAPDILVLLDKRSPTRHQKFGKGLTPYYQDTLPAGLLGYAARIRRLHPDLILLRPPNLGRPWKAALGRDYESVAIGGDLNWLVPKDMDPARREALSGVLDELADELDPGYLVRPNP